MSCPCQKLKAVLCLLDGTSRSGVCQSWPFLWELDWDSQLTCTWEVSRCFGHSLQAGALFPMVRQGTEFPPSPAQFRALAGCVSLICRTRCLYECIGECREVPAFPLSELPLLCLAEVLSQVFLHLEKLLQVWAGFWGSWRLHPLGAKKVLFE